MIYTPKTKKAMIIAYNAHNGQVDKSGIPYIYHPIHLAEQMDTETECIVALLHDVVEDTNVTFDELEKNFSPEVIEELKLLTHDKNVDYLEYVRKINDDLGIKKAIVYSVRPLEESDLTKIKEALNKKHNCIVELENKLDPGLIAVIKVVMENHVTDISMKNKIDSLKESLLKGGLA